MPNLIVILKKIIKISRQRTLGNGKIKKLPLESAVYNEFAVEKSHNFKTPT